jgi:DNA repair protein RadC
MKTMNAIKSKTFEKSPMLAEIKVSYKTKSGEAVRISSSKDAFNVLFKLFDMNIIDLKEEFFLLLLNRANHVLGWFKLSSGGTTGTVVDVKIIFTLALQVNAHGIILCHNHPSRNLKPSDTDISLTKKVKEAGKLFDITLLDHLIIASDGTYFTFADEGLI